MKHRITKRIAKTTRFSTAFRTKAEAKVDIKETFRFSGECFENFLEPRSARFRGIVTLKRKGEKENGKGKNQFQNVFEGLPR